MSRFRPVPLPVDMTDERAFPEMARAREHLRQMSDERRAQLEREWSDPEFVFDAFKEASNVR